MSIQVRIIDSVKKYNQNRKIKDRLKVVLGASKFDGLLRLFFRMVGLKRKEEILLNNNKKLKDMYKGKRCFIMGNGPSIKKMDLSMLKDEITFSVNQFTNTDIYKQIQPSFHLWADERFFKLDKNNSGDMAILEDMKLANHGGSKPIVFYKTTAFSMIKEFDLDSLLNIYYYSDRLVFDGNYKKNIDISKLMPWFPTVVQYAIIFAIYMGFSEIYLLGCDCTGILNFIKEKDKSCETDDYAYSYKVTDKEKKHFSQAMKKRTSADEFEGHFKVFQYYEWLRDYCIDRNVKLINCTPEGLLDSLQRCSLENVLGEKNV